MALGTYDRLVELAGWLKVGQPALNWAGPAYNRATVYNPALTYIP